MYAITINEYGDESKLIKQEGIPVPEPKSNQVLIKVKASSVNPIDLMKREANKKIKYKKFKNGEGAWYHDGKVYFATTETHQIWTYDIANETCKDLYLSLIHI